jgi:DNA polymerase, archaea type
MPEKDLFPCGDRDKSRFSPDFEVPLSSLKVQVHGDPNLHREISCIHIPQRHKRRFEGPEKVVLDDLMAFIKVRDPDVILFPYADTWVPFIVRKARRYTLEPTFSCSGHFKSCPPSSTGTMARSTTGALIPEASSKLGCYLFSSWQKRDIFPLIIGEAVRSKGLVLIANEKRCG